MTETGMVQTFTDDRGNTTTTHTDIAGRTVSVTDAAWFTMKNQPSQPVNDAKKVKESLILLA